MEYADVLTPSSETLQEVHQSPSVVNKYLYDNGAIALVIFAVIALMDQVPGRDMVPIKSLPFFEPADTKNLGGFVDISCMLQLSNECLEDGIRDICQ